LFYNQLLISPLFDSIGDLLYYLGIQYDITSQIKAEEEIKKLKESFAKESITKSTSELNIQTWSEF